MRQSVAATPAAQVLLYGACLVLVAAGMQAAANLVSALVLAVVLATVLAPVLNRLRTAGVRAGSPGCWCLFRWCSSASSSSPFSSNLSLS